MRCLFIAAFSMLLANGSASVKPDSDGQAIIIVDGTVVSDLMKKVLDDIPSQVQELASAYDETGYKLEVAFVLTTNEQGSECGWYTNLTDAESVIPSINAIAESVGDLSTEHEYRRVYNAILEAVEEKFPARPLGPDTVRRVVMYISDHSAGFESQETIQTCSSDEPSQAFFAQSMEDNRVGLLYTLVQKAHTQQVLEAQQAKINATGLTDVIVVEDNYGADGLLSVTKELADMLSSSWTATTSTTTVSPATCVKRAISQCLSCSS